MSANRNGLWKQRKIILAHVRTGTGSRFINDKYNVIYRRFWETVSINNF